MLNECQKEKVPHFSQTLKIGEKLGGTVHLATKKGYFSITQPTKSHTFCHQPCNAKVAFSIEFHLKQVVQDSLGFP